MQAFTYMLGLPQGKPALARGNDNAFRAATSVTTVPNVTSVTSVTSVQDLKGQCIDALHRPHSSTRLDSARHNLGRS